MAVSRIVQSAARDGLVHRVFAKVHPTLNTPVNAIILQTILSCLFFLIGNLDSLINILSNCAWFFFALVGTGMLLIRARQSKHPNLRNIAKKCLVGHKNKEDSRDMRLATIRVLDDGQSDEEGSDQSLPSPVVKPRVDKNKTPLIAIFIFTLSSWSLTLLPFASAFLDTMLAWCFLLSGLVVWKITEIVGSKHK
jgi:amino acid transporter